MRCKSECATPSENQVFRFFEGLQINEVYEEARGLRSEENTGIVPLGRDGRPCGPPVSVSRFGASYLASSSAASTAPPSPARVPDTPMSDAGSAKRLREEPLPRALPTPSRQALAAEEDMPENPAGTARGPGKRQRADPVPLAPPAPLLQKTASEEHEPESAAPAPHDSPPEAPMQEAELRPPEPLTPQAPGPAEASSSARPDDPGSDLPDRKEDPHEEEGTEKEHLQEDAARAEMEQHAVDVQDQKMREDRLDQAPMEENRF